MSETHSSQIFLGRQPILGREQQLLAYELLFRGGPVVSGGQTGIEDPGQATATVIANTFAGMSADETLGPYRGYINVDQQFLFSDLIEVLPPALVVLEILESVQPTPEVVARCRELRGKGFTLAIDDVVDVDEAYRPLLELAEIIKVDVLGLDATRLTELVRQLKDTHPSIRHLYMSGYTANLLAEQGVKENHAHFIQKPFSRNALAHKVKATLALS